MADATSRPTRRFPAPLRRSPLRAVRRALAALASFCPARRRLLCNGSAAAQLVVDPVTGRVIDANARALAFYGRTAEQLRAEGLAAVDVGEAGSLAAALQDVVLLDGLAPDAPAPLHRRQRGASGAVHDVAIYPGVVRSSRRGRPLVHLIVHDVTESCAATARLRRSEERLSLLMRAAPVGIFQATAEGAFTFANERLHDLVGLPAGEVLGEGWTQAVHPGDLPWVCATWGAAVRARGPFNLEFRLRGAEGEERWVVASAEPIPDEGYLGSLVDITVLKESERALTLARDAAEQASQSKSDFLNRMSHELRTPLTAVIGFARLLNRSANERLTEQERAFMERIDANAQHLIALISNVLDLARIDAGKLGVELAPTDLGALAAGTLTQLEGTVRGRDLVLRAEVPEGLAPLETDAARLKQVLVNLVGNAIKFTERGSVTVAIEADERTRRPRRLLVRDSGIGIPRERQAAIFEAFEQGENGTTRRFGGTGLGLAISRELCTLLGATLTVESVEGEGTTFTIAFGTAAREAASGGGAIRAA